MEKQTASPISHRPRVIFLDNLRFLFVMGVVLQHSGMAYSWSEWWPVADGFSLLAAGLVGLFDGFLMPSLFFIAGYFAIPSISSKAVSAFIKGKLKRLGIPWLACTLFIGPVLPLIYHYTRSGLRLTAPYRETWMSVMGNALRFDVGILPPMTTVMERDLFYQRYMWFIALLIFFFLIFALIYSLRPDWFKVRDIPLVSRPGIGLTLKTFVIVGFVTFVGSTLLIFLMFMTTEGAQNPESWFTLGNIVQFRVSRIFLHATYFVLGILAHRNRWIEHGKFPGHQKTWIVVFSLSIIAYFATMFLSRINEGNAELMGMVFWFTLNFFTISALGLSASLANRFLNRSTSFNRSLAANSYNLYLSHYIYVLVFQLALIRLFAVPATLKFIFVAVAAIAAGYASSRLFIKPYPRLSLAAICAVFIAMILFIQP